MISHTYQCIFIPVAQTGAYRIIHEFYPFFWENHPWGTGGSSANAFFMNWGASYGQYPSDGFLGHDSDYTTYINNYSSYYLFTLVRCPYQRYISGWKFIPSLYSQDFATTTGNLPTRNTSWDENSYKNFPYRMATKTQKKTLKNSSGTYLTFDYIMKYESIEQDWDNVCDAIGKTRSKLKNKISVWLDCAPVYSCDITTYYPYSTYPSGFTTAGTNISSSFSEDFKQFNYCIGTEIFPTGSVAVYRCEQSGNDSTGNGHGLTANNTGAWATGIPLAGGYALDASATSPDGYLYESGTTTLDFNNKSYSYCCWFKTSDRSVNQTILDWGAYDGGMPLRIYNGKVKHLIGNTGFSPDWSEVTSSLRIKNGKWNFAACRYNINDYKLYLTLNGTTYSVTAATTAGVSATAAPTMTIGKENWGNQSNCYIDEVCFWYRFLSNTEVRNLYNNGQGRYYV